MSDTIVTNKEPLSVCPLPLVVPLVVPLSIAEKKLQKHRETVQKREEVARLKLQKRIELDQKKQQYSSPLAPGSSACAVAAMSIIALCKLNMPLVNTAFRRMIASRLIFPPKKNINKFATGGIAEECVSRLFCELGLLCNNVSEESTVIDLVIQANTSKLGRPPDSKKEAVDDSAEKRNMSFVGRMEVSLKNSGSINYAPILENYRGQKRAEIRPLPPTFIVYTEMDVKRVRMVYVDHEIIRQGYPDITDEEFNAKIYANGDSNLSFRSGFLPKFIPRLPTEYILNAEYPDDLADIKESSLSRIALDEVIRQLGRSP